MCDDGHLGEARSKPAAALGSQWVDLVCMTYVRTYVMQVDMNLDSMARPENLLSEY